MLKEITIRDKAQIARINKLACDAPYAVWLHAGDIMLDARSLLGLFVLAGRKASVVVEDDVSPRLFQKLVRKMA